MSRTTQEERLAEARRRFARLMKLSAIASAVVIIAAFTAFRLTDTPTPLPFIGAIAVAVIGSFVLTAALMGLVFFSAATGADSDSDQQSDR